jgi:hypothetical protein
VAEALGMERVHLNVLEVAPPFDVHYHGPRSLSGDVGPVPSRMAISPRVASTHMNRQGPSRSERQVSPKVICSEAAPRDSAEESGVRTPQA